MDICKALTTLERIYDSNAQYMKNEEAEEFAEALESIWQYLQNCEPKE